ncbi:phage tail assembly protein T [Vreelandella alkaliphila]|uniref:DUF4035 domain-containing protein n=1 Tax=Vreelandella alkaliphila TaxID=272774 RepID=A0A7C9JSE4_9GAMM|nr:DUF4035 domain-containing protein [Halomonas alkaliphila]NDL70505.1 DUF4035 domain-containing protein [Halomonas alkaliphila]
MTLALRLGKTLAEMAGHHAPMTARELIDWMAFDQLSPISDRRADVHAAQIATAVYQSQGAKVAFEDVLIDWSGGEEAVAEDDDALEILFAALASD